MDGYAARVGVQNYRNHDGSIRRELRLPEEVFAKKYLDSFDGAPMTLLHPEDWVTPANARDLGVGTSTEAGKRDGDLVAISTVIDVKSAMDAVDAGVRELSVGYSLDLEEVPGHHPVYGAYDAIQRNLLVNHVAIVPQGRAGHDARLRVDEAEAVDVITAVDVVGPRNATPSTHAATRGDTLTPRSPTMTPEEIAALKKALGTEKTRGDNLAAQLAEAVKRADEAQGLADSRGLEITKLRAARVDEGELASLRAAVTDLTAQVEAEKKARRDATAPAVIHEMATKRLATIKAALEVDPDMRTDDLSDREIQVKTIALISGENLGSDRTDDYVAGMFKHAIDGRRAWAGRMPRATVDEAVDKKDAKKEDKRLSFAEMGTQPLPNAVRYGR